MELPENDHNNWPIERVKTSEIFLDTQNPRLNLSTNAGQAEIRRELLRTILTDAP